jgi:hypothetical protein
MSTVLQFKASSRSERRKPESETCDIVIFPGVRIERHETDLDLAHRMQDSAGRGDFDGLGGGRRPRKTS